MNWTGQARRMGCSVAILALAACGTGPAPSDVAQGVGFQDYQEYQTRRAALREPPAAPVTPQTAPTARRGGRRTLRAASRGHAMGCHGPRSGDRRLRGCGAHRRRCHSGSRRGQPRPRSSPAADGHRALRRQFRGPAAARGDCRFWGRLSWPSRSRPIMPSGNGSIPAFRSASDAPKSGARISAPPTSPGLVPDQ